MVNNSTNVNKLNNHLSPQIIWHKKKQTYGIRNPGSGFEQVQTMWLKLNDRSLRNL